MCRWSHAGGAVVGIVTLNDLLKAVIAEASALLEITSKGQQNQLDGRR